MKQTLNPKPSTLNPTNSELQTINQSRVLRADIPEFLVPVVAPNGEESSATAALEIGVLKALAGSALRASIRVRIAESGSVFRVY